RSASTPQPAGVGTASGPATRDFCRGSGRRAAPSAATDDLELGGYRVRRGYTVLMSQWVNHRDPRYFPEPDEFRPERWENGLAKRLPKFAYYPFGGGQRMCIGSAFASIEAPIVLATVGQQ